MGVPVKQEERGALLVAALIVFGLFEVLALVMNFVDWRAIVSHGQSAPGVPLGAMVMAVVALVALAGVWLWQRRAVYLLAVVVAVSGSTTRGSDWRRWRCWSG